MRAISARRIAPMRPLTAALCLAVVCSAILAAAIELRVAGRPVQVAPRRPKTAEVSSVARPHVAATVHFDLLAKLLADDRRAAANDWLPKVIDPQSPVRIATQQSALLGQVAPDFTLIDHRGEPWSLQDALARGPVVLVFYLGYSCNACVHDLCEFNADIDRFQQLGAEVVAVSGDLPQLTQERYAQFGAFAFPLLSDPDHAVAQFYEAFRADRDSAQAEPLHATFVIDQGGKICWVHCGDAPFRNNMALLCELAQLSGARLPAESRPAGPDQVGANSP